MEWSTTCPLLVLRNVGGGQCINEIEWHGAVREGYDFMSGMGECWHLIKGKGFLSLTGIDHLSRDGGEI
jgi:hypothetical protein